MIKETVQQLLPAKTHLKNNQIGLEKEALRSHFDGALATTSHPNTLGSALTNPFITTDFSEALLEMVTPPLIGIKPTLDFLNAIEYFVYQNIAKNELLWHQSMPCVIRNETKIPIAQYGDSNLGKMKTLYRKGLALRYGATMQTIAGIHFNYSFSDDFLKYYYQCQKPQQSYPTFVNESYMSLTRNVLRYGWLLTYLFGASPMVCKSFLHNYHRHSLVELNDSSLFEPHATSLRMGDIGYQNRKEDERGVKVNYNSLAQYINSLETATYTPCKAYQDIGLKKNGQYQQLNTNVLQIENEYYNNIRPKPILNAKQTVSHALKKQGVRYVELRLLDINPLLPLGIDEEQILFLEVFLLFCLLLPSEPICSTEQVAIDQNERNIAHQGRKKGLHLNHHHKTLDKETLSLLIFDEIKQVLPLLSKQHQMAFERIKPRITHSDLTPSAQLLAKINNSGQSFLDFCHQINLDKKEKILSQHIAPDILETITHSVKQSLEKQHLLEKQPQQDFGEFLSDYFNQNLQ